MGYNLGVGREAPTFVLNAVDGSEIDLKQYRGDWFPVLVFLPAGASHTAEQLSALSSAADGFWGLRGQLVCVCNTGAAAARALAESVTGLSFPVLADDGRVARAYGALKKSGETRPMAFIVDRAGKIVWTGEGRAAVEPATLVAAFREVVR